MYRDLFTDQHRYPAMLRPFDGKSPNQVAGMVRQSQNSTPVVPDDVMQPLLAAALYITSTLAPPLLRAYEQSLREERGDPLPCPRRPDHALLQRIIERHVADNEPFERLSDALISNRIKRGLMAEDDPLLAVSLRTIAREAGYDFFCHRWLKQHRTALESAVPRVGLAFPWGRDAELVPRADDVGEVPWTAPSARRHAIDLGRLLLTACMIVVAAISGMRRSELVELEPGCCLPVEETFEGMPRYKLAGKLIKGQRVGGVRDQWVVTKDVYTAVQVAERLAALRGGALFSNVVFHVRYRTFREWATGPAGQRLGLALIPDTPVNLRMLRRILSA